VFIVIIITVIVSVADIWVFSSCWRKKLIATKGLLYLSISCFNYDVYARS